MNQNDQVKVDLAIHGADVLTMNENLDIIHDGLVLIKGKRIEYCGPKLPKSSYVTTKTIEANGSYVLPAFFNQHTHPSLSVYRGLGADLRLKDWLEQVIWPLEKAFCSPDMVYLGTQLSLIEMIRNGTAAAACMDFYTQSVAKAFSEAGVRCFVGEAIFDNPTPSCMTPDDAFGYTAQLKYTWQDSDLISPYLVLHAPFTCEPETMEKGALLSQEEEILVTSHVAETKYELEWTKSRFKMTPVELIDSTGLLDQRFILVHGVHLSDSDIDILVKKDIPVIHNPHSNMLLGSGICRVSELIRKGINVGIGTDSAASNNQLSMLTELQTTSRLQKACYEDPTLLPAAQVIQMATQQGYRNYKISNGGCLEEGQLADLQIISNNRPHNSPSFGAFEHIVYSCHPTDISTLIVNGQVLMEDRKITTLDEEIIIRECKKMAKRVRKFVDKI